MTSKQQHKQKNTNEFDVAEILNNAANSIKLGIEDFITSRDSLKQSARALSAARNLYAGVLLLFKYKIASLAKTPEQAKALIYKPQAILPHLRDDGTITWTPTPHGRDTIDTGMIEARLKSLGIYHDWDALKPLRDCRNALEHLHPKDPISSIQASIAALFPMLGKFIEQELGEAPGALLGEAWLTMLNTHDFFKSCENQIHQEWIDVGYPTAAIHFMKECCCRACYSTLLKPLQDDIDNTVSIDSLDFHLQCYACGQVESAIQYLEENFSDLHEDYFDQSGFERVGECRMCLNRMYLVTESCCYWCGHDTRWPKCIRCEQPVPAYITSAGGQKCERCAEIDRQHETH